MPVIATFAVCRGEYVKVGRRKQGAIKWTTVSTGHNLKDAEGDCLTLRTKLATTLVRPFPACVAGPVGHTFITDGGGYAVPSYPHADPAM
jgi:hypothetical protein